MSRTSWTPHRKVFSPQTRRNIIAAHPVCAHCHDAPSIEADHITPIAFGGSNDETNGQGLCGPCHDVKTKREAQQGAAAVRAKAKHPMSR